MTVGQCLCYVSYRISVMRVDMDTLRLAYEVSMEESKKWREEYLDQNVCNPYLSNHSDTVFLAMLCVSGED